MMDGQQTLVRIPVHCSGALAPQFELHRYSYHSHPRIELRADIQKWIRENDPYGGCMVLLGNIASLRFTTPEKAVLFKLFFQ